MTPDITCIILAGGAGKRMGSSGTHKVCFPILGRPAIVRAIDAYKQAGLKRFIVVVGQMASQVMETVSAEHPDVTFVLQREARGTGHAALTACHSLHASGFAGDVLITMGDKVVEPSIVRDLIQKFQEKSPGLAMITLPFHGSSSAGRVLLEGDNGVLGIVEKKDFEHATRQREPIRIGERQISLSGLDAMEARSNGSIYLFRFPPLWTALNALRPDNEQGELYLTDTVGSLRSSGLAVDYLDVGNPADVMAFNTPAELLTIEETLRQRHSVARVKEIGEPKLSAAELKPAGEWLVLLSEQDSPLRTSLEKIYGSDDTVIREQRGQMEAAVRRFVERFGSDRPVVVCRAPGRINLMGRHIEHRGGDVNVMAISRETVVIASPRTDDVVTLHNLSRAFTDRTFRISELLEQTSWEEWVDFIDSATVKQVLQEAPGDWSHYARAPLLRLQHEASSTRLRGMDCVVASNIPMSAGLSSSSALVVAFAETAIALNGLNVGTADFIDLCGEGEWFVGSRGGNGDHAAIRVSKIGAVSHLGFFPFELKKQVPLPADLCLVVADSAIEATKSAGAKDAFNHRIAAYRIGQLLLQKRWPAAAGIQHLRDLLPERLGVQAVDLHRALQLLPDWPTRADLRSIFSEAEQPVLESIFATHADIGPYDLRGVVLYGLAECARSATFADALAVGDLETVGEMMRISHDGDRVTGRGENIRRSMSNVQRRSGIGASPMNRPDQDTKISASQHHSFSAFSLASLPGSYACSTPEIDELTDLATSVDGVIGAQLSGAGLGGCVMILVRREAVLVLEEALAEGYYAPRNLPAKIYPCEPVQGAGLLWADAFPPDDKVLTAKHAMDAKRTGN